MTVVSITHNWQEAVDSVMDAARHRGWTDGLDVIRVSDTIGDALGRYDSFEKRILLDATYDGDATRRILLHELGHHLHYQRVLGKPDSFDRKKDWLGWCNYKFHSRKGVEYVAWQFAHFHNGDEMSDWDEELYDLLDGPPLEEPMVESLKFE